MLDIIPPSSPLLSSPPLDPLPFPPFFLSQGDQGPKGLDGKDGVDGKDGSIGPVGPTVSPSSLLIVDPFQL